MLSTLEHYAAQFRRLRSDSVPNRWPASTLGRAPHKPLLLLAILDLIEEGTLTRNFIEATPDLGELFSIYWSKVMLFDQSGNMAMPFFHLKSDGFWHLTAQPNKSDVLTTTSRVVSLNRLGEIVAGARLDDELWTLVCEPQSRQVLRAALVDAFFAPEFAAVLLKQSEVNVEAFDYSRTLLEQARTRRIEEATQLQEGKPAVRDQGFRRAVVSAYAHRCAMCGLKILTPEGHTVVDAAHIKPWSVSRNDDPRNGLALCRLCHWNFDEGLLSVSPRLVIVVSNQLSANDNLPGHLAMLHEREIFKPIEKALWPDVNMLKWHAGNVFRKR